MSETEMLANAPQPIEVVQKTTLLEKALMVSVAVVAVAVGATVLYDRHIAA